MTRLIIRRASLVGLAAALWLLTALMIIGPQGRIDEPHPAQSNPLFLTGWLVAKTVNVLAPPAGVPTPAQSDSCRRRLSNNINPSVQFPFYRLSLAGMSLTIGLAIILLGWNARPTATAKTIIFGSVLILLLAISTANFATGDALVRRSAQAVINLVMVFFGLVAVVEITQLRFSSSSGKVLQGMVIFGLLFQAIGLPLLFSIVFWLDRQGVCPREISYGWVAAVSGIASTIISLLTYKRNKGGSTEQRSLIHRG